MKMIQFSLEYLIFSIYRVNKFLIETFDLAWYMIFQSKKERFFTLYCKYWNDCIFSKFGFQAHILSPANVNQWSSVNNTNKFWRISPEKKKMTNWFISKNLTKNVAAHFSFWSKRKFLMQFRRKNVPMTYIILLVIDFSIRTTT